MRASTRPAAWVPPKYHGPICHRAHARSFPRRRRWRWQEERALSRPIVALKHAPGNGAGPPRGQTQEGRQAAGPQGGRLRASGLGMAAAAGRGPAATEPRAASAPPGGPAPPLASTVPGEGANPTRAEAAPLGAPHGGLALVIKPRRGTPGACKLATYNLNHMLMGTGAGGLGPRPKETRARR